VNALEVNGWKRSAKTAWKTSTKTAFIGREKTIHIAEPQPGITSIAYFMPLSSGGFFSQAIEHRVCNGYIFPVLSVND